MVAYLTMHWSQRQLIQAVHTVLPVNLTCYELIYRLVTNKGMNAPELWIKRDRVHNITDSGTQWKHCEKKVVIKTDKIFVVTADKGDYMIILVDEENKEYPVVFGKEIHRMLD